MVAWVSTIAHLTVVWRTRQPPAETQTLETRFAARVATEIEAGWLVAEWPTVFASASVPVMSTHEALRRGPEALMAMAARQTVYFAGDMYCEPHFGGVEHAACESFTAAFELETVFVESLHSHGFALLRVRGLRAR